MKVLLRNLSLLCLIITLSSAKHLSSSEEIEEFNSNSAEDAVSPPAPTPSPDFDCPDLEEGYYQHQTDCTKYYHCTNGLAWLQQCADGLYFNPVTTRCDWPENVDCKNEGVTSDPAVKGASIIEPAPWFDCENKTNGAYPHETDCDKFYDCYNGLAHLGICTEDMLFDIQYDGCNFAQDVYCDDLYRPTNVPSTTRRTTTTTRQPGVSTDAPFICPEPEGLFPDPANCQAYYQCFNGNSWHQFCSVQLYFNIELRVCDYEMNVDCGDRPVIP